MNASNYTATLLVDKSPAEVFNAIKNVSAWWSENFEGSAQNLNDVYIVRFGETSIVLKTTELVADKKIVWKVIDGHKHWLKNPKEWHGTEIVWEISTEGNQTKISFTHIGLQPGMECYNGCENAWNGYLKDSLVKLIASGQGVPEPKSMNAHKAKDTETSDFTTTISVDQTPKKAFDAINNVRGWWSEEIDGNTENLNDEFKYHYQDIHNCTMKLVEVIPNKKVVWLVEDNYFKFTKDKSEWVGTKIIFDMVEKDGKTLIHFTHQGLTPAYECFDICKNAWTQYIQESLYNLITTGTGKPNGKDKPQTEDERRLTNA